MTLRHSKVKSSSSFSLISMGLFTNNSSWQAKQLIPHTTVTFYGECVKMCEDLAQNLGNKGSGCCNTTTHRLSLPFPPKIFFLANKIMTVVPHPAYSPDLAPWEFYLFPQLKIKLKAHNFETTEVTEAESQNIPTEHDFQDAFKNGRSDGNGHMRGRGLLRG
jgi:hypothetical protein